MAPNKRSLENLKKGKRFSKAPQGLDEKKSEGQIERAKNTNLLCSARTLFQNADILPDLIANVKQEVLNGNNKNAIDLLKVIKEPEAQDINLNGGIEVQKIFVEEKTKKQTDKHIDDFINGSDK